jgi:hypothetical protein
VSKRLRRARRGVRGGAARPPLGGCRGAEHPAWGFEGSAPEIFFRADIFRDHVILGGFSAHGFLPMVFYFRLRN